MAPATLRLLLLLALFVHTLLAQGIDTHGEDPILISENGEGLKPFKVDDALVLDHSNEKVTNHSTKGCASKVGCGNCTKDSSCVWCESDGKCKDGNFWGPDDEVFKGCSDWRWEQCKVNGKAVFWSAVGICALVVFLCLCCCVCCCFLRSRRRHRSKEHFFDVEKHSRTEKRHIPRAEERRALLYEKYGTPEERARAHLESMSQSSNGNSNGNSSRVPPAAVPGSLNYSERPRSLFSWNNNNNSN